MCLIGAPRWPTMDDVVRAALRPRYIGGVGPLPRRFSSVEMHVHEVLAVLEGGTPGVPWLVGLLLVGGAVVLERGLGVLGERLEAGHLAAFGFEIRLSEMRRKRRGETS